MTYFEDGKTKIKTVDDVIAWMKVQIESIKAFMELFGEWDKRYNTFKAQIILYESIIKKIEEHRV